MSRKAQEDKLAEKMETLACSLADDLSSDNEPSKQKTDGFKALSSYFAATRKLNLKAPEPEDPDAPNFGNFRDKINKA